MVLLKNLNKECVTRAVSRAIPAHIACRLLGNSQKPCALDPVCKPCNKTGVWLFYSSFLTAICLSFLLLFWVLRITKLSLILNLFAAIIIPPCKWLSNCLAAIVNFYRNLPF